MPLFVAADDLPLKLARVFHKPSNLSAGQSLRLCFSALPTGAVVYLNGALLVGSQPTWCAELDPRSLPDTNRITLELSTIEVPGPQRIESAWIELE